MKMRKTPPAVPFSPVKPAILATTALLFRSLPFNFSGKIARRSGILFFLALLTCSAIAQECFNAGLETGSLDGYRTYTGSIDSAGKVVIEDPGADWERHKIMHVDDGVDPIAALYCDSLKNLPVVPEGGGKFALRLGNEESGAEAERVVLKFRVTPDLTFFLLRYAVVLNDPGHEEFEQPRFEMRILDEQGNIFPCGEYLVRAAENIKGFESCRGGWRVRPWTTAGFELQSYLGQTVQIEILTTDCSRGGHAGYAYFEASCQPLKLDLEGYCPGKTSARIGVTEGFTSYRWNTGDTSNEIEISNPVEGATYSVTVTSATGCTLVLQDKLPAVKDQPAPEFDVIPDRTVCPGESVWIRPTGKNLHRIFSPQLGVTADSFLITPAATSKYTFTASDHHGCYTDSITIQVEVRTPSIDTAFVTPVSCFGGDDGKISLRTGPDIITFQWSEGSKGKELTGIAAGFYSVTFTDGTNCSGVLDFEVRQPPPLVADQFRIDVVGCGDDGESSVEVFPEGGVPPYSFNWSTGDSFTPTITGVVSGAYYVTVTDANNCITKGKTTITQPPPLHVEVVQDSVSCFGGNDGRGILSISGGVPEYKIKWNDGNFQQTPIATGLSPGFYAATITDAANCTQTASVEVKEPAPIRLSFILDSISCYGYADGAALVNASGGTPGYTFAWNDSLNTKSARAAGLAAGIYSATVTDHNGCEMSAQVSIPQPPPVALNVRIDTVSCFMESDGGISILSATGTPPYSYYWLPPVNQSVQELTGLAAGTYPLRVTDGHGCMEEKHIEVPQPEPIEVTAIETIFPNCDLDLPGMAIVQATGGNGVYDYFWEDGTTSDTLSGSRPGIYTVSVSDRKGCSGEGIAEIRIFEIDLTSVGLSSDQQNPDEYLCLSDEVTLTVNANNKLRSIRWSAPTELSCDTCASISARPLSTMPFRVEVVDAFGCPAEAATHIPVDRDCGVYIPNAFSPNGDGINDRFFIAGKNETLFIEKFQIFSRWGELVFESCSNCPIEDPTLGWDGTYRGKNADVGVYVFFVELSFLGMEEPVMFKGDVMLLR